MELTSENVLYSKRGAHFDTLDAILHIVTQLYFIKEPLSTTYLRKKITFVVVSGLQHIEK